VLATTQKAPVFGIVFTWELARAGVWTLAALIAVVLAVTVLTTPSGLRTVADRLRRSQCRPRHQEPHR